MVRYAVEALVPASPDETFAELLDVASWPQWVPGVLDAGYRTAGEPRAGHRAYAVRQLYGLRVEWDLELAELERPRRVVLALASRRRPRGRVRAEVAPAGAGTLVRLEVERTGGRLAARLVRRIDERTLRRLRRRLGG